jgi:hypothetical protein
LDCFLSPHPTVNIYIYREDKKKKKKEEEEEKGGGETNKLGPVHLL